MTDQRIRAVRASLDRGDGAGAVRMAGAIVDDARVSPLMRSLALRLRAEARGLLGDPVAALDDARRAAELVPGDARAWNALGIAAADAGEHADAVEAFSRATSVDAGYARAWNNLGNALRTVGRVDDALAAFERAVGADARYAHGWANLAVARRDAGDEIGAIDAAKRALALDPRQRTARLVLAGIDRRSGRLDAAIDAYEGVLAQRPDDAPVRFALAGALAERDDLDAARAAYVHAARTSPGLLRAHLGAALTLPMIPASQASIREARAAFAAGLERLRDELPAVATTMPQAQVLRELCWTNFLLAYQGEDDLDLQSAYGDLVATTLAASRGPAVASVPAPRTALGRRRVAFVSAFFRDGTVGRYFESWITGLDRDRFEVVVHQLGASSDELTVRLRDGAAKFVSHRAREPAEIARAIMEDAPDCIVYPELGMDATTFALAALRLAPLQCAGWGHPVTSGLATIDLMFTAGAMEPAIGDAHYRERLIRLPGLGTRYARPVPPMRVGRDSLGLPVGPALFLVPQSLFKLHPDDDRRIARVLAAARGSRVVAFAGRHPKLTAAWRARLDRELDAGGVDAGRVVILPQVDHDDYLRINLACDAMLDSARWSGGNTSLDAIACALPIATRPGIFMRGRQSAGMLELIGAADLVAADEDALVANAVRLAEDAPWRAELSARMRDGSKALFDDVEPVAALAAALDGH